MTNLIDNLLKLHRPVEAQEVVPIQAGAVDSRIEVEASMRAMEL